MATKEASLEDLREQSLQQTDANRDHGVIDYETGEEKADAVYEVEEGLHYAGDKRLGPGNRFRPTRAQIENDSLKGKARELTRTEYRSLGSQKDAVRGADIGLRRLPITDSALELALDAGLTEEDFDEVDPAGENGDYLKSQVEDLIEG